MLRNIQCSFIEGNGYFVLYQSVYRILSFIETRSKCVYYLNNDNKGEYLMRKNYCIYTILYR